MNLAELGRSLRTHREGLGLSRTALAATVGVRPVLVGRWERGEAAPDRRQAEALAGALGLDPSEAAAWAAPEAPAGDSPAESPPARRRWLPIRRRRSRPVSAVRRRGLRSFTDPAARSVLVAPPQAHPPSYLDDPQEQRRYTARWVLTVVILGVLAGLLVWALGQLVGTWGPFLDMFRGRPPQGPYTNALGWLGGS